ncbi:hypothetical protein [Streptomyces sp. NPDC053048]|uniref:hypothetical protein n=1 Tax=Streptomyces sp. NPDC053048 TaxID=3365694 RepID=UPI0037D333BE
MRDIKILGCEYTERLGITAKLQATNSSSVLKYDYRLTVKFYGPDRALLGTRFPSIPFVGPGKTDTLDVSQPFVPKAGSSGTVRCEVSSVTRTVRS